MTTDQKGSLAELAIMMEAAGLGVGVFKPLTDGERYDLIFDLRPRLVRVQCKLAQRRGDVVKISCYSSRRCRDGFIKRTYTCDELDAIAAYSHELRRCWLIPLGTCAIATIQLRIAPTKNNQESGVKWADDYEFAARLAELKGP
jgi:hypothetical protein